MPINIAIVEDDDELRQGLVFLINGTPGYKCVAHFGHPLVALNGLRDCKPDLLLVDIRLPKINGIEFVRR